MLESDPQTTIFEKGLGANDRPGSTCLLRVAADEAWWQGLPARLDALRAAAAHAATYSQRVRPLDIFVETRK